MKLKINDTDVEIPTDLSQVSVGKFLEYWDTYGRDIDIRVQAVLKNKYDDDFLQDLDLLEIEYDEAIAWYSFFTGFDFSIIKEQSSNELLKYYRIIRDLLTLSESEQYVLNQDIEWNNDVWSIRDWKVTPGAFTFNELLISKESTRQINSLGKGKWEALPYLSAIFFRKKGEPFLEKFIEEDSDRLKLMHELPMSYGLQVAFFLSVSVSIWSAISVSSKEAAEQSPA